MVRLSKTFLPSKQSSELSEDLAIDLQYTSKDPTWSPVPQEG